MSNSSMSKKWIIGIGLCAAAIVLAGYVAYSYFRSEPVYASVQAASSNDATIAELQQTIAELRALVNLLMQNAGGNNQGGQQNVQAGIPFISSQRAREAAVAHVGYGTARDAMLFSDEGVLTFEVDVRHQNRRYMVYVDAANGDFIRMYRFDDAAEPDLQAAPPSGNVTAAPPGTSIPIPQNITPRPPARQGGPSSPAISAQRAVELARDHLVSIGVTNARFEYVYMDNENGVWVWSVEFGGQGRSYEFYVNVNTGAFLKAPGGATGAAPSPSPQVSPRPAPSPQASPSPSPGRGQAGRPTSPAISLERAIEIGYEEIARRGHTGTFRNHSGMDFERGQWVWELVFRVQGGRLPLVEMYINVDTGAVVKFEWDD